MSEENELDFLDDINGDSENVIFSKDDNDINDFLVCWKIFGVRPSKVIIFSQFEESIWDILHDKYKIDDSNTQKVTEIIPEPDGFQSTSKFFIKINDHLYLSFVEFEDHEVSNLVVFYNNNNTSSEFLNDLLNDLQTSIILENSEHESTGMFNSLTYNYSNATYDLMPYKVNPVDESLELFYNDKTFKQAKKTIRDINKNDKGLTIYHGCKGRGKTSFMHYLMENSKKSIIHIPSSMTEQVLNNVDFIHFLEKHKGCTLIFDDSEIFFTRGHHKNLLVSNMLQMIDGVLSDNLRINILLSVNLDRDRIDPDLFKCNNLLNDVDFCKLSGEAATELSKYLKKKRKYKSEASLIEVINDKLEVKVKSFAL